MGTGFQGASQIVGAEPRHHGVVEDVLAGGDLVVIIDTVTEDDLAGPAALIHDDQDAVVAETIARLPAVEQPGPGAADIVVAARAYQRQDDFAVACRAWLAQDVFQPLALCRRQQAIRVGDMGLRSRIAQVVELGGWQQA